MHDYIGSIIRLTIYLDFVTICTSYDIMSQVRIIVSVFWFITIMKYHNQQHNQLTQHQSPDFDPQTFRTFDINFNQSSLQIEHSVQFSSHNTNPTSKYGSMIPLCHQQSQQTKYVLGPHWFVFIPTILVSCWFLWYMLDNFSEELRFPSHILGICAISSLFFIFSYVTVGISNPGLATFSQNQPNLSELATLSYCRKCQIHTKEDTRHCEFCNVCVLEMDHHCIWVGKCIGKNNMFAFKMFLFSALQLLIVFAASIYLFGNGAHIKIK